MFIATACVVVNCHNRSCCKVISFLYNTDCTVSTSLLATLLVLTVTAFTAIIISILMKPKLKFRKKEPESQTQTTNSDSTPEYEEVSKPRDIQTKENVAYGSKVNK